MAVAVGVGNIKFNSRATFIMKNLRRGTAAKRPKNAHTSVMVRMRPKSSLGLSDNRLRRYIAGKPATNRPAIPPAPVAEAWIIEFS
jgi:hypothetical protein